MTEERCPKCGIGTPHKLEQGLTRCRKCDSYFKRGKEIQFTESGSIIYIGATGDRHMDTEAKWGKVRQQGEIITRGKPINDAKAALKPLIRPGENLSLEIKDDTAKAYFTNYERLEQVVRSKGTVKEVAQTIGISPEQLRTFMRGSVAPATNNCRLIIEALGKATEGVIEERTYEIADIKAGRAKRGREKKFIPPKELVKKRKSRSEKSKDEASESRRTT